MRLAQPVAPRPIARNPLWKRKTAHWSRWVHTYLSMVSFTILLFFAVTGITLNHQASFNSEARTHLYRGALDPAWLKAPEKHKDDIVATLRSRHRVKAALSDFRVDGGQVQVSFKGPGYGADGFIDQTTGRYEINESRMGLVAVINDLHKGRDTGPAWSGVIDISAALMTVVSVTGLILIFFLNKKLKVGLWVLAVGSALCYAVYAIWVP